MLPSRSTVQHLLGANNSLGPHPLVKSQQFTLIHVGKLLRVRCMNPMGLIKVRTSWAGHPRLSKKKKMLKTWVHYKRFSKTKFWRIKLKPQVYVIIYHHLCTSCLTDSLSLTNKPYSSSKKQNRCQNKCCFPPIVNMILVMTFMKAKMMSSKNIFEVKKWIIWMQSRQGNQIRSFTTPTMKELQGHFFFERWNCKGIIKQWT